MRSCNWAGRAHRAERARDGGRAVRRPERREPELLAIRPVRPLGAERRARAAVPGRLLLQDLHVAAELVAARLRTLIRRAAAWAGRRPRPIPIATSTCTRTATSRGRRRPAGLMAALAAGRSGARVILVDEQPELGGALLSEPSDHPGAVWLRSVAAALEAVRAARAHAHHGVRLLRPQLPGLLERVTDHLPPAATASARQRLWKVSRQVVLATGALERPWCSPTTTGRASCWRAPCALTSTAMGCGPAGAPWCSPTTTARIAPRSTCAPGSASA